MYTVLSLTETKIYSKSNKIMMRTKYYSFWVAAKNNATMQTLIIGKYFIILIFKFNLFSIHPFKQMIIQIIVSNILLLRTDSASHHEGKLYLCCKINNAPSSRNEHEIIKGRITQKFTSCCFSIPSGKIIIYFKKSLPLQSKYTCKILLQ